MLALLGQDLCLSFLLLFLLPFPMVTSDIFLLLHSLFLVEHFFENFESHLLSGFAYLAEVFLKLTILAWTFDVGVGVMSIFCNEVKGRVLKDHLEANGKIDLVPLFVVCNNFLILTLPLLPLLRLRPTW